MKRIDIHTHVIPPFWAEGLKSHGGDPSGWRYPEWNPDSALQFMDALDIEASLFSLTAPGVEGWVGSERTDIVSRINNYSAELIRKNPSRFGYLATLPLPDINASLREITRAYDTLGVDGVVLHSNHDGIYVSDALFNPIWEELNRRSSVVFLHPTTPPGLKVLPNAPGPLADYPADTTRSALNLVIEGHLTRFPKVKIVLSHGGGYLPYAAHRFAQLEHSLRPQRSVESLLAEIKSFYFDTALVGPTGLAALLSFAQPNHVIFGTDNPYASAPVSNAFTNYLDSYPGYTAGQEESINLGAARTLFPRFAGSPV